MTNPLFPPYNSKDLINGKAIGYGYTFTFETDNPMALNIANADHLIEGYRYDLAFLRTTREPGTASPQVRTLYNASKSVDYLWICLDQGTQEITGSGPGDPV